MSREKTRLFCPGTSDLNGTGKGLNNKISGIKLVFSLYATIKMMHGPINIRLSNTKYSINNNEVHKQLITTNQWHGLNIYCHFRLAIQLLWSNSSSKVTAICVTRAVMSSEYWVQVGGTADRGMATRSADRYTAAQQMFIGVYRLHVSTL